ncbi:MAG: GNAT family N-acetyltransferase [Armatimonadetes bacterium]|nr:GNAT family N-acetyltransferase [Armatimonadota bacterium]
MRIRTAARGDEPGAAFVVKAVYDEYGFTWDPEDYHKDLYDLEEYYASPHRFFVAESEDGTVVGTSALHIFPRLPDGDEIEEVEGYRRILGCDCALERLYVHPDHRRSGVGGALLQAVLDYATDRGCVAMEIWSDKRFEQAHRLYQRLGARVIGDRICHDPDQSPEWGLKLSLQK